MGRPVRLLKAFPCGREELDKARVVHCGNRRHAVIVGRDELEQVIGGQNLTDRLCSTRMLEGRLEA